MSDLVVSEDGLVEPSVFYAPAKSDAIDGLVGRYRAERAKVEELAALAGDANYSGVMGYFINGNMADDKMRGHNDASRLFRLEGAVAALNARFWQEAMALSKVYDFMPQARRDEWNQMIRNPEGVKAPKLSFHELQSGREQKEWAIAPIPEFDEEVVRDTIFNLLNSRGKFLAERIEGIFKSLSQDHVTNCPQGFSKRMILNYMVDGFGMSNYRQAGLVSDLRCVIARFMGVDEPGYRDASGLIKQARETPGEWLVIDGGAIKIRVYKKGTAHLEVHPDMAWRLNAMLASLHPNAIPAELRRKPTRRPKERDWPTIQRPLPESVLRALADLRQASKPCEDDFRGRRDIIPNAYCLPYGGGVEAGEVLVMLGAKLNGSHYQFSYNAWPVIRHVVAFGVVPDRASHQFYPTPDGLAARVVEFADIKPGMCCLEPSAGIGRIADLMPKGTVCVETADIFCRVLEAKGYHTINADFLMWAKAQGRVYDRVVMNPPFSEGRWQAHLFAASELVADKGVLVAILPPTCMNRQILPADKWDVQFSDVIANAFADTSVSVVMMKAMRR